MKNLKVLEIIDNDFDEVNLDKLPRSLEDISYSALRPDCKLTEIIPELDKIKYGFCVGRLARNKQVVTCSENLANIHLELYRLEYFSSRSSNKKVQEDYELYAENNLDVKNKNIIDKKLESLADKKILQVFSGDKIIIVGENGVGKTTLFKIIKGLVCSFDGSVKSEGNIGYLPQSFENFCPASSTWEYLIKETNNSELISLQKSQDKEDKKG
ncbi:158_t:CDS:2 [Funneliformis geosporum]|uniref:158_t:CDS:1 n=1 Tax=Funneliformis geosporum TaxID=1117311 RepID=A0A9W4SU53_9GLOM|nr:158_t:CDS:2 [Funneliformis geosporum]